MYKGFFIVCFFGLFACTAKKELSNIDTTQKAEIELSDNQGDDTIQPDSLARPRNRPGPGGQPQDTEAYKQMIDSLNLSESQNVQFQVINQIYADKFQKKREEIRSQGGDFQSMRTEMRKIREEQNLALQNLLTEEQFGIYQRFLDSRQQARRGRRSG